MIKELIEKNKVKIYFILRNLEKLFLNDVTIKIGHL